MLKRFLLPSLLALPLFASSAPAIAQPAAPPLTGETARQFIDPLVSGLLRERHIPGAAVVVVLGDEVIVSKGYGISYAVRRTPVDPGTTLFRLGSVTKLFTATAVMQLIEEGKLSPGDDVNRHLRGLRVPDAFGAPVTIGNLLTHTAGFDERLAHTAVRERRQFVPLHEWLRRELPARVLPPGRFVQYSNHGYALLGEVVATARQRPFEEVLRDRIFVPLGMKHTAYGATAGLHGYVWEHGRHMEVPQTRLEIGPAADVTSTADDVARFVLAHLHGGRLGNGRILGEAATTRMHSRLFSQHPLLPGLTYGFWEGDYFHRRALYHLGGVRGFGSLLMLWPDLRLGVFVVNNGDDQSLGFAVADGLLGHFFPAPPPSDTAPVVRGVARSLGDFRFLRHGRATIERLSLLRAAAAPVSIDGNGRLLIDRQRYFPVAPGVYQQDGSWERAAILDDDHLAIDADVLERVPWYGSASLQQTLLILVIVSLLLAFFSPKQQLLTLGEAPRSPSVTPPLLRWTSAVDLMALAALVVVLVGTGPGQIWFGFPPILTAIRIVLACAAVSALASALTYVRACAGLPWRERMRQGTVVLAQLGLAIWLAVFRLFG